MKRKIHKLLLALTVVLLPCGVVFGVGETSWSDSDTILIARGDNNFPPFEFLNEKGEPDGFNVDFFKALMEYTGLEYDLKLERWDSVVANFDRGKIDVITGTTNSSSWDIPTSMGIPYFKLSLDVLSRKNNIFYSLDALKDKVVAVQRDTWTADYMKNLNMTDSLVFIGNIKDAIIDLSKGKYDAVVCSDLYPQYLLNREDIHNLIVHKTHVGAEEYSVVVKRDEDSLLSVLNRGIFELKINGTYDAIYNKWFSPSNDEKIPAWVWIVVGSLLFLGVVMGVFILVLRMRIDRATAKLKRRENDLKRKNRQLLHSFNAGQVLPFTWDIKKNVVSILHSWDAKNDEIYTGEELPLEKMLLNIHPDDRKDIEGILNDVKDGKIKQAHHQMRYKMSANQIDYSDYFDIYVLIDKDQDAHSQERVIGYMQNITKRKEAELALEKNENFLREIMDSIPFPVHIKDVEDGFKYTFWNKQSTIEFGDVLFKTLNQIMSKEEANKINEADIQVYQTGEPYVAREDFFTNDGKEHRTLVQKKLMHIEGKKQILIVRWDIGNMLNLQKDLERANRLNEIILNNSTSGFAFISPEYKVMWENLSKLIGRGRSARYIPGEYCYKSVYNRDTPCENCIMANAFAQKDAQYFEIKDDDGTVIKMVANPVFNDKGEKEGLVLHGDDITKSRRMHEDLRINKDRAEQANKLKSAFLANMSHEIRTPLNAIVGFSELMKTATEQEERDEYGRIISANSDILLSLINDILDLSKIEAGCLELKNAHFDLSVMFRELEMTFSQRMPEGVALICSVPFERCVVNLDKKRITQVVINFTSNAIKFTKHGSITIGYSFEKNKLRIFVKDTGCGIKKEKRCRVFGRFEKLNDFAQGTGLGLAICKSIAEANGGIIGFETEENVGSTFFVEIPCTPVAENVEEILTKMLIEEKQNYVPNEIKSDNDRKKTILVAEDNDSNYLLVHSILRNDFNLVRAENGAEVLELMQTLSPDVILMDIKMPILDGLETTKTLREMGLTMPIIAVTANAFDQDKTNALDAGCDDFLSKPLNKKSLTSCLIKYIKGVKQA